MFLSVLFLLAQAATSSPASPEDVVVVGRRAEQDLTACLARDCPPAEDVEASLNASVEQFGDGRYVDAQRTLQSAIRRNKDHAAELPGPVSSLYATLATVAEHEGLSKLWRHSARNNVLVLRRHLGRSNLATLGQELSFADNMVGLGLPVAADKAYLDIQRRAVESSYADVAAGAAFRRAWLALLQGRSGNAVRFADEAVRLAGADNQMISELRDILKARIAIRDGDADAVDILAARLRRSPTKSPQLLFAPKFEDIVLASYGMLTRFQPDGSVRFIDVGYWIRPDGRPGDVEILRNEGIGRLGSEFVEQVGKRRYAPLAVKPGNPGIYRIDRFTVRAAYGIATGSRIPQRTGKPTVHVVDLTETDAMSAKARQQLQESAAEEGS